MQEMQEMWVLSLGWEDPLEEEMATQSGILAWKIPRTEDPVRLWSWGCKEGDRTECAHTYTHTHTHSHTHISKSSSRKEKKIRSILRDEICRVSQSSWKNLVVKPDSKGVKGPQKRSWEAHRRVQRSRGKVLFSGYAWASAWTRHRGI